MAMVMLLLMDWIVVLIVIGLSFGMLMIKYYLEKPFSLDTVVHAVNKFIPYSATVKRNNEWLVIDSANLVPGDIIALVGPGSIVPADCRLLRPIDEDEGVEAVNTPLRVSMHWMNQSTESHLVFPGNDLLMGAVVVSGPAVECLVRRTAYQTHVGQLLPWIKV